MNDRSAFKAWLESQSTRYLARLAVSSAKRGIVAYYEFREPEEYMRNLFLSAEYSNALAFSEEYLQHGSSGTLELLVAAVPALRNSIELLEANIEDTSGGADIVRQRQRALSGCKAVLHAVIALVWPRGSEEELSQCADAIERGERAEHGGRHNACMAIEFSSIALGLNLMPFLISMGLSG